jgi:isohexenylglutaconyl-CoA hydratase
MHTSPHGTLQLERADGWLTVWLNRPERRNALDAELMRELLHVLDDAAPDRELRGITLRGRGGVFCAGGDLKEFRALATGDAADLAAVAAHNFEGGRLFQRVETQPQVVVVLV